jgi:hypothetical protein
MSCEKHPDCLSPTRVAPLALAAFLALVSSEEGFRDVCILKVLATFFFLYHRADTPIIRPRASSERDVFPPPGVLRSETNDNSVAILLTYATPRVLLVGDAEAREEHRQAVRTRRLERWSGFRGAKQPELRFYLRTSSSRAPSPRETRKRRAGRSDSIRSMGIEKCFSAPRW